MSNRIILISVILSLFVFPVAVFATEPLATVSITPSAIETTVDSQVIVSIDVSNVENLSGVAFDLIFDPTILSFVSAEEGNFLNSDEVMTLFDASINPDNNGNLIILDSRWEGGISGSGTLMTLTFQALATGTSNLDFQTVSDFNYLMSSLMDAEDNPILIDTLWTNGLITIEEPQPAADITPPSIFPLDLTATPVSSSQIDLSWSTSTDPEIEDQITSGLAGYKIYRNGTQIATSMLNSYSDIGLTASTTYEYAISAYDVAKNESERSDFISATTLAEIALIIPAQISIAPATTTAFSGSQFTITISIDVKDVSDLFGVAFDLIFDPDILEFVSASKGDFLGSDGVSTWLNTATSSEGLIVGYSRLAQAGVPTGINGRGTLMSITFNALATGTSTLSFQRNHLLDPGIKEITTNWEDSVVIVETPLACASFFYSDWSACQSDNTQLRTVTSSLPTGCTGGNPILSQSCAYAPPALVSSGSSGGGGGGGPLGMLPPGLTIQNETIASTTENSITITWTTSYPATSQVIYAMEGESHILDLNDSKYGYARITPEYDVPANLNGVISHSVIITDLEPGIKYYYRTVSHGSLAISQEYSVTTQEIKEKTEEIGVAPIVAEFFSKPASITEKKEMQKQDEESVSFPRIEESAEEIQEPVLAKKELLAAVGSVFSTNLIEILIIDGIIIAILMGVWLIRKRTQKNIK